VRILFIGDIVGRPGRQAVAQLVPALRRDLALDLVIANGENAAGGKGITPKIAQELFQIGIDAITLGNHTWHQREIIPYLNSGAPIIRPLNYPPNVPGKGMLTLATQPPVTIINLIGRIYLNQSENPFIAIDQALAELPATGPRIILIDIHAEATSEKAALAWDLDGRVSAVIGTHTHVPTADARILPRGTAFVTDVGMVGPLHSIIGVEPTGVIQHMRTQMPVRFEVASGPVTFNALLLVADDVTGQITEIERIDRILQAGALEQ